MRPCQFLSQWLPEVLSPDTKWAVCEADHSPPSRFGLRIHAVLLPWSGI